MSGYTLKLNLTQNQRDLLVEILYVAARNRKLSPTWRKAAKEIVELVVGYDGAVETVRSLDPDDSTAMTIQDVPGGFLITLGNDDQPDEILAVKEELRVGVARDGCIAPPQA